MSSLRVIKANKRKSVGLFRRLQEAVSKYGQDGEDVEVVHVDNTCSGVSGDKDDDEGNGQEETEENSPTEWRDSADFSFANTFKNLNDLGQVRVTLVRARGLYGADFNGKSDPFAIVAINHHDECDVEFRSATHKRTVDPEWNETFVFPIRDINDYIDIRVFDEDRFQDPEFLGRLAVPVYSLTGSTDEGEHDDKTFALKNNKLQDRARGSHPQIVLRFRLEWSLSRAAIKTIRRPPPPKERPFKRGILIANVQRLRKVLHFVRSVSDFIKSCFEWEQPTRSATVFMAYELLVFYFEPYMLPLMVLAFTFIYPLYASDAIVDWLDPYSDFENCDEGDDDGDSDETPADDEKENKKTLSERYKAIMDVSAFVQNGIGQVASMAERIKNLINFSSPHMSCLFVAFLLVVTLLLYLVPLRLLFMLYGVNKFTKKLIRPGRKSSSEILNFLSRVPDDPALERFQELSIFDQQLLKAEEEERIRRENSSASKITKRVSAFLQKADLTRDRSSDRKQRSDSSISGASKDD